MKRKIAILLTLVMAFSTLPIVIGAQGGNEPVVLYRLSDDPAFANVQPGSEFDFEGNQFLARPEYDVSVEIDADGRRYLQLGGDGDISFRLLLSALEEGNHVVVTVRVDAVLADIAVVSLDWDGIFVHPTMIGISEVGEVRTLSHTVTAEDFGLHQTTDWAAIEGDIDWGNLPMHYVYADAIIVSGYGFTEISVLDIVIYEEEPLPSYVFNLATDEDFLRTPIASEFSLHGPVVRTHGDVYVRADADGERYLSVHSQHVELNLNALEPGNFLRLVGRLDSICYHIEYTTIDMHSIWPARLTEAELREPGEMFVLEYLFTEEDFGPRETYHWCGDAEDVVFGMYTPSSVHIWVDYHNVVYSILEFAIYHEYPVEPELEPEPEPTYSVMRFTIGSTTWIEDGVEQAPLEAAPFISGNRAMVPLRFVAEAMGAEVDLIRGTPRVVTIDLGDTSLRLTIGEALPDGMGTPVLINGRVFVPIGYVSEILGATTRWCGDTRSVYVYVPAE